jgi:hypothetical protein
MIDREYFGVIEVKEVFSGKLEEVILLDKNILDMRGCDRDTLLLSILDKAGKYSVRVYDMRGDITLDMIQEAFRCKEFISQYVITI